MNIKFAHTQTIDAINGNTLMKYSLKFNEYIDQTVAIICGNLSPAEQINIESLLILDIHGMIFIVQ